MNSLKNMWTRVGLVLCLILGLAALFTVSAGAADQITIKFGIGPPITDPEGLGATRFAEIVSKKSDGRIKVQVYPLSQLGAQQEMVEGVRMGTIEMTMATVGFLSSYDKFLNIFELPYLYKDHFQSYRVFDGPVGADVKKRLQKDGFEVLAFWEAGQRHLTNSRKPIKTPADLKGLKIRVPQTKASMDALTAMGATPVAMAFPELYSALQQKVVDGQENPYTMPWGFKLYEVQKYLSKTGHQILTHVVMVSPRLWDKLSEADQKILIDAANEARDYERAQVRGVEDTMLKNLVGKGGMVVNEVDLDAFREAVEPLYAKYGKEYGPDAAEIIKRIQNTK